MSADRVDPSRCPLCGQGNGCGMVAGSSECWCFSAEIPADVLNRVPAEARGGACVCRNCASKHADPAETLRKLGEVLRQRSS